MEKKYTKQDLILLVEDLKEYTKESQNILGYDEREAEQFVDVFLDKHRERFRIIADKEKRQEDLETIRGKEIKK